MREAGGVEGISKRRAVRVRTSGIARGDTMGAILKTKNNPTFAAKRSAMARSYCHRFALEIYWTDGSTQSGLRDAARRLEPMDKER